MVLFGAVDPSDHHEVSVVLIVVGSGMFFVGALLPTLTEFQVGPTGFSAKLRERDLDFEASLGPEAQQLMRVGTWLAGGTEAGRELVERALAETYLHWPDERAHNPADGVRERMVEMAPPASVPPTYAQYPQQSGGGDLLSTLRALPVAERSALVLHLLEGLDTNTVASITKRDPAAVATDIAQGATNVITSVAPPPPETAW